MACKNFLLPGVLLLSCLACSGGGISGKWVAASLPVGAGEKEVPLIHMGMQLDIQSNGTYHMNGFPPSEGKWKQISEGKYQFTPNKGAERMVLEKKGDRLIQVEPKRTNQQFFMRPPKS